jgi:hypothetical protein
MSAERFIETADCHGFQAYSLHDVLNGREDDAKRALITAGMEVSDGASGAALGMGWLEAAASHYNVSRDPKDYVIAPVSILVSGMPNRNGVAFPLRELAAFDVEYKQMAYETWTRSPVFYEHANEDHTKALGVIFDTTMRHAPEFAGDVLFRVNALCGVDRTRAPMLANRVLTGNLKTWSMGASVAQYQCSICGHKPTKTSRRCEHMSLDNRQMRTFVGASGRPPKLAHYTCAGIRGFETSMVEIPAWASAQNEPNQLMSLYSPAD